VHGWRRSNEMGARVILIVAAVLCALLTGLMAAGAYEPSGTGRVVGTLAPVGSGFTYQGRLKVGSGAANGYYDLRFSLYDAAMGGNLVSGPVEWADFAVADGLFTVQLNFGPGAFSGEARWLEIAVRQSGGLSYTVLSPRQAVTPAPYAQSLVPGATISGTLGTYMLSIFNTAGTGGLFASGGSYGVDGRSEYGKGVFGISRYGSGVEGLSNGTGDGVHGQSLGGWGVYGYSGATDGVYGQSAAADGRGVAGVANSGLFAKGVSGSSSSGYGGYFTSGSRYGVYAEGNGPSGAGVFGASYYAGTTGIYGVAYGGGQSKGVWGSSSTGTGVYGTSSNGRGGEFSSDGGDGLVGASYGANYRGVVGQSSGAGGMGVYGISSTGYGVAGYSSGSEAGHFYGDVGVTGNLSKGGGSFKIDHPLDPANKYLYHSFVESPDMLDVYRGHAMLDAKGEAWVQMPAWFEALNSDFDYQLTAIGTPGPDLHIAQEVHDNRFRIAGGRAGMKVSWQVTGVRQDLYANAHRIPVEEDKPAGERGKYLYPQEYGRPESEGIEYEQRQMLELPEPAREPEPPHR
jgi:hypothetical protein